MSTTFVTEKHVIDEAIAAYCLSKAFGNIPIFPIPGKFSTLDAWSMVERKHLSPEQFARLGCDRYLLDELNIFLLSLEFKCRAGNWEDYVRRYGTIFYDVDKHESLVPYIGRCLHPLFAVRTLGDDRLHVLDASRIDVNKFQLVWDGRPEREGSSNDKEWMYLAPCSSFRELKIDEPFYDLIERERDQILKAAEAYISAKLRDGGE